jgi:hypothetical protein
MPTPDPLKRDQILPSTLGGKKRSRKMRGGFESYTPTTGLAVYAAPFSGPTAEPHTKVGGRTRRSGRKAGRKGGKRNGRKTRKH